MIKTYTKKPIEVEAIQFQCTPEEVIAIKELGGNSIGPITKAVNSFSSPTLNVETVDGRRSNIKEGDYIIRENGKIYTRSKVVFETNYQEGKIGDITDGYHSFNELYQHRCILFSIICNTFRDYSWKSWLHSDGTMFTDYFIVGVTTPQGNYTYHYHKDEWDRFNVKEIDKAPEWDGHTASDITRLYSLLCG